MFQKLQRSFTDESRSPEDKRVNLAPMFVS